MDDETDAINDPGRVLEDAGNARSTGHGYTAATLITLALVKWLVAVAIALGAALTSLTD